MSFAVLSGHSGAVNIIFQRHPEDKYQNNEECKDQESIQHQAPRL